MEKSTLVLFIPIYQCWTEQQSQSPTSFDDQAKISQFLKINVEKHSANKNN